MSHYPDLEHELYRHLRFNQKPEKCEDLFLNSFTHGGDPTLPLLSALGGHAGLVRFLTPRWRIDTVPLLFQIFCPSPKMNPTERLSESPDQAEWQRFLEAVIADFDCTTGTLHQLDPADGLLKLVAQRGIPEALMPMVQAIPVGKGIAGAAAERRAPVEICNLQTDTSGVAKPGAKQTQVQGSLAVPVLDADRLCGTLGVGKLVPYDFTDAEKQRLINFAAAVANRLLPG
jgi:hypothetical protein